MSACFGKIYIVGISLDNMFTVRFIVKSTYTYLQSTKISSKQVNIPIVIKTLGKL